MIDGTIQPDTSGLPANAADEIAQALSRAQDFNAANTPPPGWTAAPTPPAAVTEAPPGWTAGHALTPEQRQAATQIIAEKRSVARQAPPPGWTPRDPLDVYTDDQLLEDKTFNTEDYFRAHQVAIESDPKKTARVIELHRKAKSRGMQWGEFGKGLASAAGEIVASPYGALTFAGKAAAGETAGPKTAGETIPGMLWNLGRTVMGGLDQAATLPFMPSSIGRKIGRVLVGETAKEAETRKLEKLREGTEALSGVVADTAGLAKSAKNLGEKVWRKLPGTSTWDEMPAEDVLAHLRAGAADKQALEELSQGETVALEATRNELKAKGIPVRPEEVARHQEGGMSSWLTYGMLFRGIHAGTAGAKKFLASTEAAKLADNLVQTRGVYTVAERKALGFTTADNAAVFRKAGQAVTAAEEAVAKSRTASTLAALQSAKAGLANFAQRATAGAVEKVGQALQLPEKLLHKIPGGNIGATAGTIAGMFTGGLAGGAKVVAARLAAAGVAKAGQAVESVGAAAAPGVSRTIAQSRAADFAKAFNDSVGKALGPGGLGMDVATSLVLAPEGETPTDIPVFMGTMRLFKGLPVGLRRVVGGELVGERQLAKEVPVDPAYGNNSVLDRGHAEAMKLAGPEVQDKVNFIRALGRKLGGQLYLLDPQDAAETIKEAHRQSGQPITLEEAQQMAAQNANAVFTTTLRDRDGNPQKVVFAFGEAGMTHDVGHLLQSVFPESVNRSIDALIAETYKGEELENFARRYLIRVNDSAAPENRLTPEEFSEFVQDWRNRFKTNQPGILDAEHYMLRELGAENIDKSFGSRAEMVGDKPGLYRTIAYSIARLAEILGVDMLGQTEHGFGTPVSAEVQRANEIALSDILASPEHASVVEVDARRAGAKPPKTPGAPTPKEERAVSRAVEQATDAPPPADAVVPAAEAQNARQITEVIADVIRKGGGMLKAWYRTAPGSTDADLSSAAPVSEVKARKAAIEAARSLPEAERPLWERLFFAYGLSPSSRGPQVKTWNSMVFAANAVRWAKSLFAAGAAAESPYPIVNGELTPDGWRQLRNDLQVASRNYLAGYGASGVELGASVKAEDFKQTIEGAGYRVPEKTTPSPEQLPQDRADVINYLLALETTPKTARLSTPEGQLPLNLIGQIVSRGTIPGRVSALPGAPVYQPTSEGQARGVFKEAPVAEVNPFRAKMRQLGVKPELFSVLQRLNVEHLAKVEAAPEQPAFAANLLTVAGGFSLKARTELIGGQFSLKSPREDLPEVKSAAVRDRETGKLYAGFAHFMAFERAFENTGPINGVKGIEDISHPSFEQTMNRFDQGFLVKDPGKEGFRFVDREEAKRIGRESGQLERDTADKELDSEDLNWGVQASLAGERVRDLATMTPDEFERGPRGFKGRFGGGASAWAMEQGASAKDQSDASAMRSTYEALRMAATDAMSAKNSTLAMEFITRAQTAREAYEVATGEMIDGKAGEPGALREARKYEQDFQAPLGETVRAATKAPEAPLAIEPAKEPGKAKVFAPEGQAMPVTSSFGKRLEEEGFEFRVTGQRGVRTVEVWKDGEQVGELQSSQTKDATTAYVGNIKTVEKSSTGEEMRKRGLAEAMYRELANTLQEDGVTQIEGMAVHPSIPGLHERVFGNSQIETGEGVGISPKEVADYIAEKRKTPAEAFYAEIKNAIRPKAEGQYSLKEEKKEHRKLFEGYHVESRVGQAQGEGMLRDNILDALSTWQGKGTIEQLQKHLEKFSGTREEAQWTGLNKWLEARKAAGENVLTKGEVEDFIVANQVRLEELTLNEGERPYWSDGSKNETEWGGSLSTWDFYRSDNYDVSYGSVGEDVKNERALQKAYENKTEMPEPELVYIAYDESGRRLGIFKTPEEAQQEVESSYVPDDGEGEAQYGRWTLPGGNNYREILVKLPDFPQPPDFVENLEAQEAFRAEMVSKYGSFQDFRNKRTQNEAAMWETLKESVQRASWKSPHFQDSSSNNENLIAHMRVKTRKTLDNKTLFFIEEIQSDLHQEGAKSGYESEVMSRNDTVRLLEMENILRRISAGIATTPEQIAKFNLEGVTPDEATLLIEEVGARWDTERKAQQAAVPDAPFKGAGWKKLLMKRAIIAAAEQGTDALGWTTGDMQRSRYNLAKFIGSITYQKEPNGTYSAEFWKKDAEPGSSSSALAHEVMDVPLEKIAELAGADVARQMEAGEGTEKHYNATKDILKRGKAVEVFSEEDSDWLLRFEDGSKGGLWMDEASAKKAMVLINESIDNNKANPRRELTPEDLSLGGKGKNNLYDREMVNLANELGKKYGAKVEMKLVSIPGEDAQAVWTLPVTDALRKTAKSVGFGQYSLKGESKGPDERGFFSAARRTLEDKMPNRASAQQVKAILSPNNGVKPEELKWTGLDDFLKDAEEKKTPLDKAAVIEFLDNNAVQIEEHWKASREARRNVLPPQVYPESGPKWQRYKQRGGKYYRELVWTWENPRGRAEQAPYIHRQHWGPIRNPLAHARMTDHFVNGARTLFIEELQSDLHQKGRHSGYYSAKETKDLGEKMVGLADEMDAARRVKGDLQAQVNAKIIEALGSSDAWLDLQADPEYARRSDEIMAKKERFREMESGFSKDSLFREIQSLETVRSSYIQHKAETAKRRVDIPGLMELEGQLSEADKTLGKMHVEYYKNETKTRQMGMRPPEAPFSKSWREIFFRRLVNYAARMGYDAVSWTTGAQQASMYEVGLRAQVDTIRWEPQKTRFTTLSTGDRSVETPNPEGAIQVTALKNGVVKFQHTFTRDGEPVEKISGAEEDATLIDVVGESLAKKIQSEESGRIEGEHLATGAKWMQEVYDVILPEYARKFGKKFGATVKISPHGAVAALRPVPLRPSVPREHPGLFEPTDVLAPKARSTRKPSFTAWSMNITPEMRKSVVETGTVQFSLKATAPAGGEFKIEPVKTAWGDFPNAVMHTSIVALQKHPDYSAAKAGDPKAAVRVTRAMVKPDRAAALAANFPEAKLLPVRADEAKGRNALPSALAVVLSSLTGLDIATGIVQASRAHHTGASDVERVERRAEFAGPVEEGGKYILLDDVSTSGSTLAALRAFIRRNGGEVVGVSVLGAAHRPDRGHGSHVALRDETLAELKKLDNARLSGILQRYDLENIEDLSNGEARIILREARKAK